MKTRIALVITFALATTLARAETPPLGWPVTPPSATAVKRLGTLSRATPVLQFKGAVNNQTPLPLVNNPVPPVCSVGCNEFSFANPRALPFIAAIHSDLSPTRTGSFNPNDGFDLYVYGPDGLLVQAANGIGADGQALEITNASKGTYTLVATFTYAQDPGAAYHGEVRALSKPTWQPGNCTHATIGGKTACFELPVLQALPAYDVVVGGLPPIASTPLGFPLPLIPGTPTSCYIDETLGLTNPQIPPPPSKPVTRCLRFTADVRNVGAGALEVRLPWLAAGGQSGFIPGECRAEQLVTAADGEQAARAAGDCLYHLAHAHFHYKGLVSYTLYRHGTATKVGASQKASFCLADDDYFGFATAGPNGARGFVGQPGCNVPAQTSAAGVYVTEGVSPGWGDVYTWDTPDQFIDITATPPGSYDLVMKTNPNGALLVAGPQQTCALTVIKLDVDKVTTLSATPSIACP